MALLFLPPLNAHEQSAFQSLSTLFGGMVINPAFLPDRQRPAAEEKLKGWCDRHEMKHWPSWVTQWHTEYQARQKKAAEPQGAAS